MLDDLRCDDLLLNTIHLMCLRACAYYTTCEVLLIFENVLNINVLERMQWLEPAVPAAFRHITFPVMSGW